MVDKVRGGTAIYGLYRYVRCEGYGFQAVYSKIGYIYQSVWVQNRGSFFRKLISWLKILSRLGIVVSGLLWLHCASDLSSFWKTATLGQGGVGVFTLVQGNKIQLNWLWCRLRVPGSQRDIPTQKFLKYPPRTRSCLCLQCSYRAHCACPQLYRLQQIVKLPKVCYC